MRWRRQHVDDEPGKVETQPSPPEIPRPGTTYWVESTRTAAWDCPKGP
jgi:hypothetical protein